MFDNIGNKIKILAQVVCWLGIIGSFVWGIIIMIEVESAIAVLPIIVGPLVSWIGSFILYSWGETVENINEIKKSVCRDKDVDANDNTTINTNNSFTTTAKKTQDNVPYTKNDETIVLDKETFAQILKDAQKNTSTAKNNNNFTPPVTYTELTNSTDKLDELFEYGLLTSYEYNKAKSSFKIKDTPNTAPTGDPIKDANKNILLSLKVKYKLGTIGKEEFEKRKAEVEKDL